MTNDHTGSVDRYRARDDSSRWERRTFLAVGGGVGATLFAGCTSDSVPGDDPDGSDDGTDGASNFRLLISDRPADIDDFDSLEVTFDSARIFTGGDGEGDDEEDGDAEEGGEGDTETPEAKDEGDATAEPEGEDGEETDAQDGAENESDAQDGEETDAQDGEETDAQDGEETDAQDGEEDEDRGFYVMELDEVTVDLTEVVGEKAMEAGSGELSPGTYQKLELHVSDVQGAVDGEEAEVKVPSEKLQLTKPFEIVEGESVDFVFDINVVKRGNEQRYNLKPVISKSGVVGQDVDEHEEVDDDDAEEGDDESTEADEEETETEEEETETEETETDETETETEQEETETEEQETETEETEADATETTSD